jgi:hypothetical protein
MLRCQKSLQRSPYWQEVVCWPCCHHQHQPPLWTAWRPQQVAPARQQQWRQQCWCWCQAVRHQAPASLSPSCSLVLHLLLQCCRLHLHSTTLLLLSLQRRLLLWMLTAPHQHRCCQRLLLLSSPGPVSLWCRTPHWCCPAQARSSRSLGSTPVQQPLLRAADSACLCLVLCLQHRCLPGLLLLLQHC